MTRGSVDVSKEGTEEVLNWSYKPGNDFIVEHTLRQMRK